MVDTKLNDEPARLAALHRYEILDTRPEPSFDRITGLVKTIFNVPIATISLIDAERQWFKSCMGLDAEGTSREDSFCTHTIKARQPMNVGDALLDERFRDNVFVAGAPYVRSYLGVPLATPDGYQIGSLCVIDMKTREYRPEQIEVLKSFAALVMDEIELRRLAQQDSLTGAMSRRAFLLELEKAHALFRRHGRSSAVLVIDIDHFKQVNDTYGHPVGDLVLRTVGRTLPQLLRKSDAFGRLGGEEFGILLAESDQESVLQAAERIRVCVEDLLFEHKAPIRITTSIGIAVVNDPSAGVEQWLSRADEALYVAKRSGRNRYCSA